jgi:hypothetical protein
VTAAALLADLRQLGVILTVKGDSLQVDAPRGALTDELRTEIRAHKAELIRQLQLEADGRDILAALADRGITVRLGADGRPVVRPAHLVDEADRALLAAHREAVLAALKAPDEPAEPELEGWHSPCRLCGSRGPCQRPVSMPDGGWACQEALDVGLIDPGDGEADETDGERRQHEMGTHFGRSVPWWRRADGELICSVCHPPLPETDAMPFPSLPAIDLVTKLAHEHRVHGGPYQRREPPTPGGTA